MENRKKNQKLASVTGQEAETNDPLTKEDQNLSGEGVGLAGKNTRIGSPPRENTPSLNQQCPQIVQWPYTAQPVMEQPPSIPRPIPTPSPSPSPVVLSQWQQNPTSHQVQHGQPTSYLAQSATPFWVAQQPGYHIAGANGPASYQPFGPLRAIDPCWQTSAITGGGGTSSRNQLQIPSFCYHVGYPYPGFPGPWDPSSWCSQPQQPQPCAYAFPGACGYFSSLLPPLPAIATPGQSFQRGIIQPPAKLSQKHQQLWEAQSAENVQLWSVIGHLQSELADQKSHLMKLEVEISSLKPTIEEAAAAQRTGTCLPGQTSKRGRPRRTVASVDELPSPDESHPRARGRKPAQSKIQTETKLLNFQKESLKNAENNEKVGCSTTNIQQENDEKTANLFTTSSVNIMINGNNMMMPTFHNQLHQDNPGGGISKTAFNSSPEMKNNDDETEDSKTVYSILSQQTKGVRPEGASATYVGASNGGCLGWPSNITSEDSATNVLNMSSQPFYTNDSVIRQGGKVVHGWNFVNEEYASEELEDVVEEYASEELEDVVVGSAKDEDEEEIGDDASSGAEEIDQNKDEGAYNMDASEGTSTRGLPHLKF